eukprot:763032-Hanusia_phi.AAC.3
MTVDGIFARCISTGYRHRERLSKCQGGRAGRTVTAAAPGAAGATAAPGDSGDGPPRRVTTILC